MKAQDFKHYSNDNLRLIRRNLVRHNLDALPEEITDYINNIYQNLHTGNSSIRILRCIHFIDEIIVERFINKKIN